MKFAMPFYTIVDIPLYIVVPILWFMFLWGFRIFFMRCECGEFYHTDKERNEFLNFVIGSILSSLILFAMLVVWA